MTRITKGQGSVPERILARIRKEGRGSVWTPRHFAALGSPSAVQHALARLAGRGVLTRLGRGLYAYPEKSTLVGEVVPAPEVIARALARARGHTIAPTGAEALNRLGLSTQVPGRPVYLTSGPSRVVRAGGYRIELRHAAQKRLWRGNEKAGLVLRAIEALGPEQAQSERVLRALGVVLTPEDRVSLARNAGRVSGWMRPLVKQIARGAGGGA